ncbi:ATP-binding protein [Nocardiopsis dassonvillei]|uniref:ATP-binding protein n=1 Tax=Nocardiopsis dassonvillei TaxID=2014 RepID=UPI00157C5DE2|nr:ATP-binding protein [Nocardiopsis dassonvillei]
MKFELAKLPDGHTLWNYKDDVIEVLGGGLIIQDAIGEGWLGSLENVRNVAIASLRREAARYSELDPKEMESCLWISDVPEAFLDDEESPVEPISLGFRGGETYIEVEATVEDGFVEGPEDPEELVISTLSPLVDRLGMELVGVDYIATIVGKYALFRVCIRFPYRGKVVGDAYEAGVKVLAYLGSLGGSGISADSVLELVRDGHVSAILGQVESSWLEVKGRPYLLKKGDPNPAAEKIELAQDVARFANSDQCGILLVGLSTSLNSRKEEEITSVRPVPLKDISAKQYRAVIDSRVFPPVEGLKVEVVEVENTKGLLIVYIPRQPDELKPFLVHGSIVAGRTEGAFISIVRRRGDDSIPLSPASIHSALAAGNALLRSGQIRMPPSGKGHDSH